MLLDTLRNDPANYIHLVSLLRTPHEIIVNTGDSLLLRFTEQDTYIAETTAEDITPFLQIIDDCHTNRLETTNEAIYDYLSGKRQTHYKCYQYGPFPLGTKDPHLQLLRQDDLEHVIATHGEDVYIRQLHARNRLFGYYLDGQFIGYAAYHIDNSVGALYVDPAYRRQGYGGKIISAAASLSNDACTYSQVLVDNTASVRMHESLQLPRSGKIIHWIYDDGFSYRE